MCVCVRARVTMEEKLTQRLPGILCTLATLLQNAEEVTQDKPLSPLDDIMALMCHRNIFVPPQLSPTFRCINTQGQIRAVTTTNTQRDRDRHGGRERGREGEREVNRNRQFTGYQHTGVTHSVHQF